MRSLISLFVLVFISCSADYHIRLEPEEANDADVNAEESAADASTTEEPTETATGTDQPAEDDTADDPVDPKECNGFLINEGYDHYEETETFALFSIVGDSEIEVRRGETARLQFAVTASNCGDLVFTGLTVVQSVIDYTPAQWVTDVESSELQSQMANLSGSAQFGPSTGYNCNEPGYDSQLFYWWRHDIYNANIQSEMDEVYIDAATTEMFAFFFTATEYIPVGTSFDLYLMDPEWTDVGTGAEVWDSYYYSPSFEDNLVSVRVTIVE